MQWQDRRTLCVHRVRTALAVGGALLAWALAGCSVAPQASPAGGDELPLADALFQPVEVLSPDDLFRLDPIMRAHLERELRSPLRPDPSRPEATTAAHRLVRALGSGGPLRLDYDASRTRTAQETFHERAGHCLSLVILTAAFADAMGLEVRFHSVPSAETWEQQGDLQFHVGHVNLALSTRPRLGGSAVWDEWLLVDFLPGADLKRQRHDPLTRERVVAMFMNNRAAEHLAQGQLDAAYAWAAQSLRQDPAFAGAANTLGVVYLRRGEPAWAERALRHALRQAQDDDSARAHAWSNLALALQRQGREEEAQLARAEWQRRQPVVPFADLLAAQEAMRQGEWDRARRLVQRELTRMPDQHELHYWLAVALVNLGQNAQAALHLDRAIAQASSRPQAEVYARKRQALQDRR